MNKTKSPIKNLPVHVPGQEIKRRMQDLVDSEVVGQFAAVGALVLVTIVEWEHAYFHVRPMPKLYTLITLVVVWWTYRKFRKVKREMDNLYLGLIGERAVGQYLEENLMPLKYHVFHDVPGEGFNLDHVVAGPGGVFCVETKTRSKPATGPCHVQYDGKAVRLNGGVPDGHPVAQARAAANWLHELLEASTGKNFPVQPMVLFPGWFVESAPGSHDVWVLNEKGAPAFIQNSKNHLPPEDISLIAFHLKRYIISADAKAA